MEGCGWPVAIELPIPLDWPPGAYVVKVADERDGRSESEHLFFLRAAEEAEPAPLLLLAATSTWIAYSGTSGRPAAGQWQQLAERSVAGEVVHSPEACQ